MMNLAERLKRIFSNGTIKINELEDFLTARNDLLEQLLERYEEHSQENQDNEGINILYCLFIKSPSRPNFFLTRYIPHLILQKKTNCKTE